MGAIISLSLFILIAYLLAELDLDDTRDHQDQARLRRDVSLLPRSLPPPAVYMWGCVVRWSLLASYFSKKIVSFALCQ